MRIHILSDLHLEFGPVALPHVPADVTVLAGDVCPGMRALAWVREQFPDRPVIYVLGNHEFYGGAVPKLIQDFHRTALGSNVHVLENESIHIGGVRFLGCTLWTDFCLFGDPTVAGRSAAACMNDYRRIRVSPRFRRLKGMDTVMFHACSVRWLKGQFTLRATDPTVVVTHHAPSARSLNPADAEDLLSAAYASNLDELVTASNATLWIHGHTHYAADYYIGKTRILSNQHGYFDTPSILNPSLVVEV